MAMFARWHKRARAWLVSACLIALAACGGGAGSPDAPADPGAPPMAVSQTVTPAGATMAAALAGGGQVTLLFPAGAVAADTRVTVTPAAPGADEWTRFTITPGVGAFARSVTVRVRPPTTVSAAQVPIMQIAGADGVRPLRTRALGGEYVVELYPQLAASLGGIARPASLVRRADGHEGGTTLAGTGFVLVCQTPEAALADAQRVIDGASGAAAVLAALATIAMLEERCAGPGLDEATLLRVAQALREFGARIPQLYRNALAAWQAVDYLDAEIQLETFRRGVRRLLALCAAARELGAELACPATEDYEPQYVELAFGFGNAADAREATGSLRLLFDQLVGLPAEAELFGMTEARAALRHALARIADRLMDRDYALCNHGALFEWRVWIEGGGISNRSPDLLRRAMAYCGITATAARIEVADGGGEQRLDERSYTPGDIDGNGRVRQHAITVPRDGQVVLAVDGRNTRCSRVLGAPEVLLQSVSLRVGSVEIGTIRLPSRFSTEGPDQRELRFDLRELAGRLGRAADSMAPIVIDVWWRGLTGLPCSDSSGGTMTVAAEEEKLYTLELGFPRDPSGWRGTIALANASVRHSTSESIRGSDGATVRVEARERIDGTATLTVDTPRLPFGQTADMDVLFAEGSGSYSIRVVIDIVNTRPETRCPFRSVQVRVLSFSWSGTPFVADRVTLRVDADGGYVLVGPRVVFNYLGEPRFGTSTITHTNLGGPADCPPSSTDSFMDPELGVGGFGVHLATPLAATGSAADGRIAGQETFTESRPDVGLESAVNMSWSLQAR